MAKLNDINTKDILSAISMACNAMSNCFNVDDENIPYFRAIIKPSAFLGISLESHMPGRHLNALLNVEDSTDISISEEAVGNHTKAAFLSYSGALALPMDRGPFITSTQTKIPNVFNPHHIREGFHALYSLIKYRGSEQAEDLAEKSIKDITNHWNPITDWDYERIENKYSIKCEKSKVFVSGLARAIGPLVKYYKATSSVNALALALVLKEKLLEEVFDKHGSFDTERFGTHAHSITCVMSSLAQLAELTKDSTLMNRVKAFYDNGLWTMRDELGWSIENCGEGPNPDEGEMNNTGDIVETALILGDWGYTEYYGDAERIIRCHILPSQLRDISFIKDPANPNKSDGKINVGPRLQGAWGFPAPFGHEPLENKRIRFNLDVVGGTVASLCEAYRSLYSLKENTISINLLFDQDNKYVKVSSPYPSSEIEVLPKSSMPLSIRIPKWANRNNIKISGPDIEPIWTNGYCMFPSVIEGKPITISTPLRVQTLNLKHKTRNIEVKLKGDEVLAMQNFGADLTFFEPID